MTIGIREGGRMLNMLLPSAALVLVGWVDYLTGPLLAFFPFYLVVLVLIAVRNRWIVAMLYGLIAAVVFLAVDLATNPGLRWTIFPYWRALGQLMSFTMVTFTIPKLMEERQRLAESEAILTIHRSELQELNARLSAALEELDAAKGKGSQPTDDSMPLWLRNGTNCLSAHVVHSSTPHSQS